MAKASRALVKARATIKLLEQQVQELQGRVESAERSKTSLDQICNALQQRLDDANKVIRKFEAEQHRDRRSLDLILDRYHTDPHLPVVDFQSAKAAG